MKRQILIIEDDVDIAHSILYNLERQGKFQAIIATSGEAGLRLALEKPPDLIILDINLPEINGFEVCRRLRLQKDTAATRIIMLTARTQEEDKVSGLGRGADDYVTKPFSMRELLARVEAVLRRFVTSRLPAPIYDDGALFIDYDNFEVRYQGQPVRLTRKEFFLLKLLAQSNGRVLTREYLLSNIWSLEHFGDTRTVDVHIRRLRQKLGNANYIETLIGVGYRFVRAKAVRDTQEPA
ncbi:MAG: response regulator transcription factor [Acidobacteria bacterium]|nr:response regulator transcription factor [Acidobacteriota bacterium]MBI3655007.1 response regulator transcription factor [Acidobacteriota bacterium]